MHINALPIPIPIPIPIHQRDLISNIVDYCSLSKHSLNYIKLLEILAGLSFDIQCTPGMLPLKLFINS